MRTFLSKIGFRDNLLAQFSIVAFVIMLILGLVPFQSEYNG